jgi:hypothetical protein
VGKRADAGGGGFGVSDKDQSIAKRLLAVAVAALMIGVALAISQFDVAGIDLSAVNWAGVGAAVALMISAVCVIIATGVMRAEGQSV